MTVSTKIRAYLKQVGVNPEELSKILDIPMDLLLPDASEELSAEQFLSLCSYLDVNPYSFFRSL